MNIRLYPQLKASGNVALKRAGKAYAATVKRWSSDFGTQAQAVETALDIEVLQKLELELKESVSAVQLLITDLKALP